MLTLKKLLNKPKLEDGSLLSLFYYCDIAVNHQMQELNALMRTNPDNLDRRSVLIRQLKEAQHNLMNVIMSIADQVIPDKQAPRDFRAKYPDDVLLEQISGPIWFGAECIAAGSHIANHELESNELRPYATHLSKVITKVRQALRFQSYASRTEYPEKIKDMLVMFDELWADFEFRYVSLMCNVKSEAQYYHQQDVVVLFCESTLRAVKNKNLSYDMIEMMDPSVMFAIPRLAILCGLVVYPDGPLNPTQPTKEMPHCFRAYRQLLSRIKELLNHLTPEQVNTLEKALCSAEGLGTLEHNKIKAAAARKKAAKNEAQEEASSSEISPATPPRRPLSAHGQSSASSSGDTLSVPSQQMQRSHSFNLDSRESSTTVFEPLPVAAGAEGGAVLEDEEPFPHLGANEPVENTLPSTSTTTPLPTAAATPQTGTSSPPSLAPNPSPARSTTSSDSKTKKSKPKGPAGFQSAEDLMHRLFLGISGVADQLQTNHAKDLRVILKNVFTVCQSEPESPDDTIPCSSQVAHKMCSSVDDLEPCTPEPQSPLITASQRFNFPTESLTIEQTPSWIPDSDSPACSLCTERFSWKRRRHHCRSCGNVVCSRCSPNYLPLFKYGVNKPVRVCTNCFIRQLGEISRTVTGITGQPLQVN